MSNDTPTSRASDDPTDWDALARYVAGESPADEAERLRGSLAANPARAELVAALTTPIDALALEPAADLDVEGALRRVRARMDDAGVVPLPVRRTPAWWSTAPLRAAAVVLLLLAGGLVAREMRRGGAAEVAVAAGRTYTTAFGEREWVRLADGSDVLLGPRSELVVAAEYGDGARAVELSGEALFEVVHDADRPFSVRAGGAEVRDLGTRFTVSTGASGGVRVVVTSGTVSLAPAGAPESAGTVLGAGDRAVLDGGRARVERAVDVAEDLAWTRGRLVFLETPLDEVAVELWRWYGARIRIEDPALRARRLTASFEGEALDRVLEVVRLAVGAELEMRGDTAVLRGAGRPSAR